MPRFCVLAMVFLWPLHTPSVFAEILKGRVLEDHSGNPLTSARVGVLRAAERGLVADLETDSRGRFRTPNLPAGEYHLKVSKPNYVAATLGIGNLTDVTIRLVRRGVITGQVTDAQNRPIRGAVVFPMVKLRSGGFLRPPVFTTSDKQGVYRLHGLSPGEYAVAASLARFGGNDSAGAMFYPSNVDPGSLSISGGEEYRGVDFAFRPVSLHQVSGTVKVPESGSRFAVSLVSIEQPALAVAVQQTEPNGSFRFKDIPAGSYHLLASGPVVGRGERAAVVGSEPRFGRTHVELAGHIEGLSVAVREGRSAQFVLSAEDPQQALGVCPTSAEFTLWPLEDWGARVERHLQVSFGEEQQVNDLAPGRYHVWFRKLGESCFSEPNSVVDLGSTDNHNLVRVFIAPAGSIRGRLLSTGSARPSDFAVVLVPADPVDGAGPVQVSFPDAEFHFGFRGLRPGAYRILAQPTSESRKARWVPDLTLMFRIEVPGGVTTDLELPARAHSSRDP